MTARSLSRSISGRVRQAVTELVEARGIQALAICFLHSYLNPDHEMQAAAAVQEAFPNLHVSTSAEIFPNMREYERWTTATINAYAQPMVSRYLDRLAAGLDRLGFRGRLYIMGSNGGTIIPEVARRFPVRMLESGPAAGALMSALLGEQLDYPNVLSYDMGGTTAKGCLIRDMQPLRNYGMEVARVHEFKAGSGLPVRIPVIDLIEIGAGGGSIAEIDARGVIRVGPRSAGASRDRPAMPAAAINLQSPMRTSCSGYLDPRILSRRQADAGQGRQRNGDQPARGPLSASTPCVWPGVFTTSSTRMWARAFRIHASEQGFDYRTLHHDRLRWRRAAPRPAHRPQAAHPPRGLPGRCWSDVGARPARQPLSFEIVKSGIVRLAKLSIPEFVSRFEELERETTGYLRLAEVPEQDIRVTRRLDMRYLGQGHEIEVTLPEGDPAAFCDDLPILFAKAYERVFSMSYVEEPIEIVNWKIEARGPLPQMGKVYTGSAVGRPQPARKADRSAYFGESAAYRDCPVYDRYLLKPGDRILGPAFIEENESTCVIGLGDVVTVDAHLNLIAELSPIEVLP